MTEFVMKIDTLINKIKETKKDVELIDDSKLYKESFYTEIPYIIKELIIQLETWKTLEFTNQLLTLASNILVEYDSNLNHSLNIYSDNLLKKYNEIYRIFLNLESEIKRVQYLSLIKEKNIVLVGGNGVGKSSFASYLKDSISNKIVVIPAQKFLFFNSSISKLHLINKEDINLIQNDNFIRRGRFEDPGHENYKVPEYMREVSQLYSKFITVVANEQIKEQDNIFKGTDDNLELQKQKKETILYKLNSLWENLIPDINFEVDTITRTLIPIKDSKRYSLNAMSDGEKSILYYITYVLLAESDSFIVVDEPETFLNASNFNRLWDTLEAYKSDCKFIYISHVVDFIVSRSNTDLLWCKSFDYPNNWDIKKIDADDPISEEFPRELLSELLGARKPILFCEGEKSSLDYTIYSSLFKDEAIVYPVGGHNQVIQYTKSYNKFSAQFNGNNAMGIIDLDLMDNEIIESYKKDYIYTLKFNEIEMLLLTEEVIVDVLQHRFSDKDELRQRIEDFKKEVLKVISKRIGKISFEKSKKYVDTELSNYRINESETSDEFEEEIKKWFKHLDIAKKAKEFEEEIKELIRNGNYEKILEICPLKEEISKGVANKLLDSNYEDRALNRIKQNESLSEDIKTKYFDELVFG